MKDNALSALMIFFMAVVAMILIDDLTAPEPKSAEDNLVKTELEKASPTDLATNDELE